MITNINTNAIAFSIIAKAMRKTESLDPNILCPCICEILENTYSVSIIDDKLKEIGMSTTNEIITTINSYIKMRFYKKVDGKTVLSKDVKNVFSKVNSRINTNNNEVVYNEVLKVLKETYPKRILEYKSVKLGLGSKKQIIDLYSLYLYSTDDKKKSYRNVCSLIF